MEHMSPDDVRYDGFRINELWLAVTVGPDNQEAVLSLTQELSFQFHIPPGIAMAGDEIRAAHLRELVEYINKHRSTPVKVKHFRLVED